MQVGLILRNSIRLLAAFGLLISCSSSHADGAAGSCAPGPNGAAYLITCDAFVVGVELCTEYYGNVPTSSLSAFCTASKGTISNKPCPSAGSLGSCTNIVTSGSGTVYQKIFRYTPAGGSKTPASYADSCQRDGSTYEGPTGAASLAGGETSATHTGCSAADPSQNSGTFAGFSVQLTVNNKYVGCTNYFGDFSDATVRAVNGVRSPCPDDGTVSGTCDIRKATSSGATHVMAVEYGPAEADAAAECMKQGGTYSTTYTIP